MTVVSPDTINTPTFALSGCPLNTLGVGGNMTPASLPPNGVIYVDDAAPGGGDGISKTVSGANPFDDKLPYFPATDNGKYAQTCATDGSSMPCYFGWTSAATQDSEGDAFVSGTLAASSSVAGELTIGTSNDIIIDGDLKYADCTGHWVGTAHQTACNYRTDGKNDGLGLIADQYVEVSHPIYPTKQGSHNQYDPMPNCGTSGAALAPLCTPVDPSNQNITIDAAILALTQSFGINNYASGNQMGNCQSSGTGCIILYGSLQQEARGAVGIIGNSGFGKYYTWDPRLELVAPPSYLNPGTASYNLNSSAISSSLTCPPLNNVYGVGGTTPCLAAAGPIPALPIGTPTDVVTNLSPARGASTFTATITGPSGGPTPNAGALIWTLTGPVTSCASTTGPTTGSSSNVATYTCVITTASGAGSGPYSATATYPGDGNYYSTGSNTDTFSVP
jgi:hypothetical protein